MGLFRHLPQKRIFSKRFLLIWKLVIPTNYDYAIVTFLVQKVISEIHYMVQLQSLNVFTNSNYSEFVLKSMRKIKRVMEIFKNYIQKIFNGCSKHRFFEILDFREFRIFQNLTDKKVTKCMLNSGFENSDAFPCY